MPIALADRLAGESVDEFVFPASVTITRTSEEDFKSRQLLVWIDGERLADLMWGDSVTRDLQPGLHRIRVSNTLVWKTVEFTVHPGQQVFFEAVLRTGLGTLSFILLIGVAPLYLTIRRMDL